MNKGKRILKRSFCVILAAGLMVSLASCNKKNQQGGTGTGLAAEASNAEASKEAVYRFDKEIALGDDLGYVEKAMRPLILSNIIYPKIIRCLKMSLLIPCRL